MDLYILIGIIILTAIAAIFYYGSIILKEGEKRDSKK